MKVKKKEKGAGEADKNEIRKVSLVTSLKNMINKANNGHDY